MSFTAQASGDEFPHGLGGKHGFGVLRRLRKRLELQADLLMNGGDIRSVLVQELGEKAVFCSLACVHSLVVGIEERVPLLWWARPPFKK
jgi:hypothetical protein